jgi:hypothetical protein
VSSRPAARTRQGGMHDVSRKAMFKHIRVCICLLVGLMGLCFSVGHASQAAEQVVIYPQFASEQDTRYNDLVALLTAALEKTVPTNGPFTLQPSAQKMNELRYVEAVKQGKELNIIWRSTSQELEQELRPIRIPLRKGLLGYRIFLIRQQDQAKFAAIQTLDQLKQLKVGQGMDWGDVKVFETNGIPVVKGSDYEGLFTMLINGRFDYFSRGINEAYPEYEARKDKLPDLHVEENLLLYYPWPYYFFTSKANEALAQRVETGLEMMLKDGTFDKIFYQFHQATIDKANVKQRRLFKIENPLLPPETPLARKELWYDPLAQ